MKIEELALIETQHAPRIVLERLSILPEQTLQVTQMIKPTNTLLKHYVNEYAVFEGNSSIATLQEDTRYI